MNQLNNKAINMVNNILKKKQQHVNIISINNNTDDDWIGPC